MLNRDALNRSLDSLIQMGNEGIEVEQIREYVVLYNQTLQYIRDHFVESEALRLLYGKFPAIEYKEFNTSSDKAKSSVAWLFWTIISGVTGGLIRTPAAMNPEIDKYYNDILEKIPVVNTIASEMIMRLGE